MKNWCLQLSEKKEMFLEITDSGEVDQYCLVGSSDELFLIFPGVEGVEKVPISRNFIRLAYCSARFDDGLLLALEYKKCEFDQFRFFSFKEKKIIDIGDVNSGNSYYIGRSDDLLGFIVNSGFMKTDWDLRFYSVAEHKWIPVKLVDELDLSEIGSALFLNNTVIGEGIFGCECGRDVMLKVQPEETEIIVSVENSKEPPIERGWKIGARVNERDFMVSVFEVTEGKESQWSFYCLNCDGIQLFEIRVDKLFNYFDVINPLRRVRVAHKWTNSVSSYVLARSNIGRGKVGFFTIDLESGKVVWKREFRVGGGFEDPYDGRMNLNFKNGVMIVLLSSYLKFGYAEDCNECGILYIDCLSGDEEYFKMGIPCPEEFRDIIISGREFSLLSHVEDGSKCDVVSGTLPGEWSLVAS